MTGFEEELQPFFDQEMGEEMQKRESMRPLQMLFDVLRRGNYASANMAHVITENLRGGDWEVGSVARAIWGGLTGQDKRVYADVVRDTWDIGHGKVFEEAAEGSFFDMDWASVLGFVLDIVADPLTYVTFGGKAKSAQIVAGNYAQDAVRIMSRELTANPQKLSKITKSRWATEALQELATSEAPAKMLGKLAKSHDNLARFMNQVYQEAYKKGLNRTAQQLPGLTQQIVQKRMGAPASTGAIDELTRRVSEGAFTGAGQRFKARVLGKEIGIGDATPFADTRRRSWERFKDLFEQAPGAENVRNAIWGVMNKGPIGHIKQALGVRNPYQKYLRNLEREKADFTVNALSIEQIRKAYEPLQGFSDAQVGQIRDFMASQETLVRTIMATGGTAIDETQLAQAARAAGADPKIARAALELKDVLDGWNIRAQQIALELGETPTRYYEWYIPEVFRFRKAKPSPGKVRQYTFDEQRLKEARVLQTIFGIDDEKVAMGIVNNNISGFSVDLHEMLAAKALAQAKMEGRYNIVTTFREFGLNLDEMPQHIARNLRMGGRDFTQMGIRAVDHPAFYTQGPGGEKMVNYLFDYDVADIIERTLQVTGKEREAIGKMFNQYMSWWKGMVLLTSGYTARNHYSNVMTQFLRHGPRAFNPKEMQQSVAAVMYVQRKADPKNFRKALDAMQKPEGWLDSMLNTRVGKQSLRELADEGYRRGVISEHLFAFDGMDIIEKMAKKSKTPVRSFARKGNSLVENSSRFQSFLIDVKDNVGRTATDDSVMDWAARQARQWFIDYGDLCFDTDTEILTDHGWRTIDTISYQDRVLSFNMERDRLEWTQVDYIHRAGYNGPLHYLSNTAFNAAVTPRHRWVKQGGTRGGHHTLAKEKYRIEETQEVFAKAVKIKVACDSYESSVAPRFTDDFVELCGWALTEGTYGNHDKAVTIYQSHKHNPVYCAGIEELFARLEAVGSVRIRPHNKDITAFYVGKPLGEKIRDWFPDRELTVEFLTMLSPRQLELLYDTMMKGDGHTTSTGHQVFTQKSDSFAAAFQALAMMVGRRSVARKEGGVWRIGCHRKNTALHTASVSNETHKYSGRIWCVHSSNNTVIARREGTVYISGNTNIEQSFMKKVIPFYTWIRKNLANQINQVALYPELYALVPKIEQLIKHENPDYDERLIPDWMRRNHMFAISEVDQNVFRMFRPDFAYKDLNLLPVLWEKDKLLPYFSFDELKHEAINASAPWIRDIAGRLTTEHGYNFFYRNELKETGPAPYLFRLFLSQPGSMAFADGVLRMAGVEDGAKLWMNHDGKLQMDSNMAQTLTTYIPVLRQAEFLMYLPQAIVPGFQEAMEGALNVQGDYERAELVMQLLSFYLGIKTKDLDLEAEKERLGWDIYYQSRDALQEERRRQPGYELRGQDARDRLQQSIRRLGG